MQYAVECSEISKQLFVKNLLEIELDVSLAPNQSRVAQKTQSKSVSYDAPDVFCPVQIFLNQRVGRESRAAARRDSPQLLTGADNVNRGRVVSVIGAVGYGESLTVHYVGRRIVARFIAK
jgi:hypothetical protein